MQSNKDYILHHTDPSHIKKVNALKKVVHFDNSTYVKQKNHILVT